MTSAFSWQSSVSLCPASFCTPKPNLPVKSRYLLTSYFCIPVSYDEKDIFFDINSRRSYRSSQNRSISSSLALVVGAQTWITVMLNGLPWKQTEIILLVLKLHPNTAFQTLVDFEGYSISSKRFLPTEVDIMVT